MLNTVLVQKNLLSRARQERDDLDTGLANWFSSAMEETYSIIPSGAFYFNVKTGHLVPC